jgi:mannosyltransferase OCH1-like enzyme
MNVLYKKSKSLNNLVSKRPVINNTRLNLNKSYNAIRNFNARRNFNATRNFNAKLDFNAKFNSNAYKKKIILKNNFIKNIKKINEFLEVKKKLSINYPLKQDYKVVIPLNIYQTWHTKKLPPLMYESVNMIKSSNPRFNYQLYDDNDCREFIKQNFKPDVLHAFDSLIPGAYKADLWRYCILYINGGIYLDIKYRTINDFKFINLTESEHWVLDMDNTGIYNALIVSKSGNEILYKAIRQIVYNVKNKFYGNCFLEPTGPKLLYKFISKYDKDVDLKHEIFLGDNDFKIIKYKDIPIIKSYSGHIYEKTKYSNKSHYSDLWNSRQIYL